jgi:hypothetical protein
MSEPNTPPADTKDWTWVLTRACPDCDFDAQAFPRDELPARTRAAVATLAAALAETDAGRRPAPDVWSRLEYGCHTRDVCRMFATRLALMRTEDDPLFANWDQDETALRERYWTQDPGVVAGELRAAGDHVAGEFATVNGAEWDRRGRRSDGSAFTVESLGRYFLHDLVHHIDDVGA